MSKSESKDRDVEEGPSSEDPRDEEDRRPRKRAHSCPPRRSEASRQRRKAHNERMGKLIVDDAEAGLTCVQSGKKRGLTRARVQKYRTDLGVRIREMKKRNLDDQIRKDTAAGLTCKQIGHQQGMSRAAVHRGRDRLGILVNNLDEAVDEQVREHTKAGLTCGQIGHKLNLSRQTVQRIRVRLGIRMKKIANSQAQSIAQEVEIFGGMMETCLTTRADVIEAFDTDERYEVASALREARTAVTRMIKKLEGVDDGNEN